MELIKNFIKTNITKEMNDLAKFNLGKTVTSIGISNALESKEIELKDILNLLDRHANGDWGDLSEEDKQLNDQAVYNSDRIVSCYHLNDEKIYIITEHDRSYTTIMFADEY